MKVIFSTKVLRRSIREALDARATEFNISGAKMNLIFRGKQKIFVSAHPVLGDGLLSYSGHFNPVTWYRMLQFIKPLPEQPIVIEFIDYGEEWHEEPEMKLSQFMMNF